LMIAKGDEQIKFGHLLKFDFLKYFAASCLIHFLNNNSNISGQFPFILGGMVWSWSFVKIALGALFLLPLMKKGVNQVVDITTGLNEGRVTLAVNREGASLNGVMGGGTPSRTGGRIDFLSGPLAGQSFPLRSGQQTTIGRAPSCTIPVTGAPSVSGTHCSVAVNGSMILVTDLGSTNGTLVGQQRLVPQQPTPVPDGGTVCLGNQSCAFRVSIG